jgi:ergothioneine biosynthesis protein EgtB
MTITAESTLAARYQQVRQRTLTLCKPLTPEDMMVQSSQEASPTKWHLAHTSWFFESFILSSLVRDYTVFHKDFHWLFNSYYGTFAYFPEKRLRSSFSRPSLDEVLAFRAHVDAVMEHFLEDHPEEEVLRRVALGLAHEEQHQELLMTDILNAFFTNPLHPIYRALDPGYVLDSPNPLTPLNFLHYEGGLIEVGHFGKAFSFDNETPRHRVWLEPFALASRPITNIEYAGFIADGGYRRQELWLSAGWDTVKAESWSAPLYWTERDGAWNLFTLRGEFELNDVASLPVAHVSYYEADAYARWAGARLATEFEWESAASRPPLEGNLLDSGRLVPAAAIHVDPNTIQQPQQCIGDVWEWTASAYLGYPGYRPLPGTLGEYNGKFMSGQMVLRGGSCVTPPGHMRISYRNFFAPQTRWQFSGIRLAR